MTPPEPALLAASRRYGLDPERAEAIGSFDNDLYRVSWRDAEAILRIGRPDGRAPNAVRAEVAWIAHLAAGGVPCAAAIPSPRGERVEVLGLPDGEACAVLFEAAPGRPSVDDDIDEVFVRAWGATLGRIHALSRGYRPPDPAWIRPGWRRDALAMVPLFPASETRALARYRAVLARLERLPTPAGAYGLLHGDAHRGNFFAHRGVPHLFDFYDCLESWCVAELAIALFYAVLDAPRGAERERWGAWFFRHLLAGYRSEHPLDARWLAAVPDLLTLREIDTYVLTLHHLGERWPDDPWSAHFMAGRREGIEGGAPYLDLDWAALG